MPPEQQGLIGLTDIHGIGRARSFDILEKGASDGEHEGEGP
jgi:ribosomal protein S13